MVLYLTQSPMYIHELKYITGKIILRSETAKRIYENPLIGKDNAFVIYHTPYAQSVSFPRFSPPHLLNSTQIHCNTAPQLPLIELGISKLSQRLFGYSSPTCELFRSDRTGKPILLYNSVDGTPLKSLVGDDEKKRQLMNTLDMESFSELILLHLLISASVMMEDLLLCPHIRGKTKFICLRNQVIAPDAVMRKGNDFLLIHRNYLFCLNEMLQPLHPNVKTRLMEIKCGKVIYP